MNKETEKAAWGGAFDAFGKMFERIKANPQPAVVLLVAYLVVLAIQASVAGVRPTEMGDIFRAAAVGSVFYLAFLLALPTYALALAQGKVISIGEFMRFNAKKYIAIFVASILYGLAVAGSLLLLIIPAIWVIAWFALYQMAVIDKNLGPVAALKESKRLIRNHIGKVWGIIGVSFLLSIGANILSSVPTIGIWLSAVVSFAVSLLATAAMASLYRWAK